MITTNSNLQSFKGFYLYDRKETTAEEINRITGSNVGNELYDSDTIICSQLAQTPILKGKILTSDKVDALVSNSKIATDHLVVSFNDKVDHSNIGTIKLFKKNNSLEYIAFPPHSGDNMQGKIPITGQSILTCIDNIAEKFLKSKANKLSELLKTGIDESLRKISDQINSHYNDHIYAKGDNEAWEKRTTTIDPELNNIKNLTDQFAKYLDQYTGL